MFLLAVNLTVSALSRYPWRGPRKVGFALTHFGLVVLIAGSAAVIHLSTEGMLLLHTNQGFSNTIRVEGELLDVIGPDRQEQQVDIFIKPNNQPSPARAAGLELLRYSDRTRPETRFLDQGTISNPAVKLRLQSDRMGQTLDQWLAIAPLGQSDWSLGPAVLQLRQAQSEEELQALLAPPPLPAEGSRLGSLILDSGRTIPVAAAQSQPVTLPGGGELVIAQVWPDFRLDRNNRPETASQQLNNPVVQLNVTQGDRQARWFVFAQGGFAPVKTMVAGAPLDAAALGLENLRYEVQPPPLEDYFRIVVGPRSGDWSDRDPSRSLDEGMPSAYFYAAKSSQGFKSGPLPLNQAVVPGWADFRITLTEALDHGVIQRRVIELPDAPKSQAESQAKLQGEPALLVATPDGSEHWLPWGEATSLSDTGGDYYAAFSPRLLQLPFGVALEDFIIDRNEGSESVAMWTSQISLGNSGGGPPESRRVWMNHPTWYQGWKLAQASWNPGDLTQSTLQVKREPWWVTGLTWLGSLMVVVGTAVIFYGRSAMKGFQAALPEEKAPVPPKRFPEGLPHNIPASPQRDAPTTDQNAPTTRAPAAPELETPLSV